MKKTFPDTPMGVYERFKRDMWRLYWVFILGIGGIAMLMSWLLPRDNTDDPDGNRSGLTIYVDHKTGCQYLSAKGSGVTPRVDREGAPMCGAEVEQ